MGSLLDGFIFDNLTRRCRDFVPSLSEIGKLTHSFSQTINMAVARPIRVLGLLAIGLWMFFLYQVFGPEKVPLGPGDTLENMERDPNLDRMRRVSCVCQPSC
jgi:hypothetical protein